MVCMGDHILKEHPDKAVYEVKEEIETAVILSVVDCCRRHCLLMATVQVFLLNCVTRNGYLVQKFKKVFMYKLILANCCCVYIGFLR